MKILLIVPKYTANNLTKEKNYTYAFPLGLGYICAVLKKEGYHVDILNLNHLVGSVEDLINSTLDKQNYDFVGSGHMGCGYTIIDKIINVSHNHKSKPKVIIGGPIVTSEPDLMTKALKFDFGIIGEGEVTIIELLKCLERKKDVKNVKGICYLNEKGDVFITQPRESIMDIDSIPFPDFESLGLDEHLNNISSNDVLYGFFNYPRLYHLLGSRGCPFQCTFCYHTLGDKYRVRSVKSVIEEIKYAIKRYKINCFWLNDDMFASNRERLKEFCNEMKKIIQELPYEFKWACSAPVTTVDKETLQMMKDSGCLYIGLGFESFSRAVLKSMRKPITPELIDRAIKAEMELHMPVVGNFIFGDVAETKETIKETLNYWKKNCKGQVQLHFIQPFPGSAIYQHCIKKGIIKDRLDYIKNKIHHTNFFNMTENMTDEEYKEAVKEILHARSKYTKYIIPSKLKKVGKDKYEAIVKCPFCNEKIYYKNLFIHNPFYYQHYLACRNKNCGMRFYMVSRLYKFTMDYYSELDFFRKNYLAIRDNFLRKRL